MDPRTYQIYVHQENLVHHRGLRLLSPAELETDTVRPFKKGWVACTI